MPSGMRKFLCEEAAQLSRLVDVDYKPYAKLRSELLETQSLRTCAGARVGHKDSDHLSNTICTSVEFCHLVCHLAVTLSVTVRRSSQRAWARLCTELSSKGMAPTSAGSGAGSGFGSSRRSARSTYKRLSG